MAIEDDVARESTHSSDPPTYHYPFAAAPDIIRSNQKDAYFQGILLEQLSDIVRRAYGSRFLHARLAETRTVADLLYFGLTTLIGNRTLGEEYTDIVQVEGASLRLPAIHARATYLLSSILVPYALTRILPTIRRRVRAVLEARVANAAKPAPAAQSSLVERSASYLLENLDTLTSPATVYAVSLASFYFTGAYYHLSKRVLNLRYIFARQLTPADSQRAGYEVLGVLLILQLGVQGYMHIRSTADSLATSRTTGPATRGGTVSLDPMAYSSNNSLLFDPNTHHASSYPTEGADDADAHATKMTRLTHTPAPPGGIASGARISLGTDRTVLGWIQGRQTRKCTLCLEPMRDPSATTCGHVFCWTCIEDWLREKSECPLCRQHALPQHVLPLRG